MREIAFMVAPTDPTKAVTILTELAYSTDNQSVFSRCTYRLAVAKEILRHIPTFKEKALRLISEADELAASIPESKLTDYHISWRFPVLALQDGVDKGIQAADGLSTFEQIKALRSIVFALPPNQQANKTLVKRMLAAAETLGETPEEIYHKMLAIATIVFSLDEDKVEAQLNALEAMGNKLQAVGEPNLYGWVQSIAIQNAVKVNLDWAKRMILESDWRGVFDAWSVVIKEIAKTDHEEAIRILLDRFGNYAGNATVLAKIIKIVATSLKDLKKAKALIEKHRSRFGNDLPLAYLALAEGYLAYGDRRTAQEIFETEVLVFDDKVIDRTRDSLQLAIIRRASVFLSVEETHRLIDFRSDLHEEKEEAEIILAIAAARLGDIDFLEKHYSGYKAQVDVIYELAKQVSPEAAREFMKSKGISERTKDGDLIPAYIDLVTIQNDPALLKVFLDHFNLNSNEQPHHFCTYMSLFPYALEFRLKYSATETVQIEKTIEEIFSVLTDWQCPRPNSTSPRSFPGTRCECYDKCEVVMTHLIGVMAKVNPDRAKQMASTLLDQSVKVTALKHILSRTQPDTSLIQEIVALIQSTNENQKYQARSLYHLANLLPPTIADQTQILIDLADSLVDSKSPDTEAKLQKGEALMKLVDSVNKLDYVAQSLAAVEGLALLDTRGVGKLRVFDVLIGQVIEWSPDDKLILLQFLRELANSSGLLDIQAFLAFSIHLVNSLAGTQGFWRLYDHIKWAYDELPSFGQI